MLTTYGPVILLGLAIATVWMPHIVTSTGMRLSVWVPLFGLAVVWGLITGMLAPISVISLTALSVAAVVAARSSFARPIKVFAAAVTVICALAMALHVAPGFHNPLVLDSVRFGTSLKPFTLYANFDKGAAGLLVFALFCGRVDKGLELRSLLLETLPIALLTIVLSLVVGYIAGYIRLDPKLPVVTPAFLAINLLFVCVAEESFFRALVQDSFEAWIQRMGSRFARPGALILSSLLFGLSHLAGGLVFAGLATIVGLGSAWAYVICRKRCEAPIIVHFLMNTVHFLFFTYPSV